MGKSILVIDTPESSKDADFGIWEITEIKLA